MLFSIFVFGVTYAFFGPTTSKNNLNVVTASELSINYSENKLMFDDMIPASEENALKGANGVAGQHVKILWGNQFVVCMNLQ